MIKATLIKKTFNWGGSLTFRGLVHYRHGEKYSSRLADVVLELRVLHLAGNRKLTDSLGSILSIRNLKACPHSDTFPLTRSYPLQQSHTS